MGPSDSLLPGQACQAATVSNLVQVLIHHNCVRSSVTISTGKRTNLIEVVESQNNDKLLESELTPPPSPGVDPQYDAPAYESREWAFWIMPNR